MSETEKAHADIWWHEAKRDAKKMANESFEPRFPASDTSKDTTAVFFQRLFMTVLWLIWISFAWLRGTPPLLWVAARYKKLSYKAGVLIDSKDGVRGAFEVAPELQNNDRSKRAGLWGVMRYLFWVSLYSIKDAFSTNDEGARDGAAGGAEPRDHGDRVSFLRAHGLKIGLLVATGLAVYVVTALIEEARLEGRNAWINRELGSFNNYGYLVLDFETDRKLNSNSYERDWLASEKPRDVRVSEMADFSTEIRIPFHEKNQDTTSVMQVVSSLLDAQKKSGLAFIDARQIGVLLNVSIVRKPPHEQWDFRHTALGCEGPLFNVRPVGDENCTEPRVLLFDEKSSHPVGEDSSRLLSASGRRLDLEHDVQAGLVTESKVCTIYDTAAAAAARYILGCE